MTTPAPPSPSPTALGRLPIIFIALSGTIIANFLYRLLVPAHEYPMRVEQVIDIGLDILLLAGLLGIRKWVPRMAILFWIALAAAIGSFAIRVLGGDASWWTGHLVYYLSPR